MPLFYYIDTSEGKYLHTALIIFKQKNTKKLNETINNFSNNLIYNNEKLDFLNAELDVNHNLSSYSKLIFAFDSNFLFKYKFKKKIKKYLDNSGIIDGKEIYTVVFKKNLLAKYFLFIIKNILDNIGLKIHEAFLYELDNKCNLKKMSLLYS